MPSIPVFYSNELTRFNFGYGHPFTGDRFAAFIELLGRTGLGDRCEFKTPISATDEQLELIHTKEYLAQVSSLEKTGGMLTMDTPVTRDAVAVQKLVAGAGIQAAELLMSDVYETAHTFGGFHHAGRDYGEGFCLYNDVAIAAKVLIKEHGLKRLLIIDTDAHQGNGTMDIFYEDPRVLFVSLHQDPRTLYPGKGFTWEIGRAEGRGYTVNIPMPPHSGIKQYEYVFDSLISPLAKDFKPEIVIRNGGSDPYIGDELTVLGLDLDGLNILGRKVREIVENTSGNLLDMMVSGYDDMVIYGWLALFCGLENLDFDYKASSPIESPQHNRPSDNALDDITRATVREVERELKDHWSIF
jgi:acetoin utilization protein AcuC